MNISIHKGSLEEILHFRDQFLHENNFHFVCNKCPQLRMGGYIYLFDNDVRIGYKSVWGTDRIEDRGTILEFFVVSPFRKHASLFFQQFSKEKNLIYVGICKVLSLSSYYVLEMTYKNGWPHYMLNHTPTQGDV